MEMVKGRKGDVIFVWATGKKAAMHQVLKRAFGSETQIIFMPPGVALASLDDAGLALNGLRRLTKDEFIAAQEAARIAAEKAKDEAEKQGIFDQTIAAVEMDSQ